MTAARWTKTIAARQLGFVRWIACDQLGYAVITLGGGRKMGTDNIDFSVGFERPKKIGDAVKSGEPLKLVHHNSESCAAEAERMVQQGYAVTTAPVMSRSALIAQKIG